MSKEPPRIESYGVAVLTLEVSIPRAGTYALELYSGNKLCLVKPYYFLNEDEKPPPFVHKPQLSALFFAEAVLHRELMSKVEILRIMTFAGLEWRKGFTIVSVWDNVLCEFQAEFELAESNGLVISTVTFPIPAGADNFHTVMYIDLPPGSLKAGQYKLRVKYNGRITVSPLILR